MNNEHVMFDCLVDVLDILCQADGGFDVVEEFLDDNNYRQTHKHMDNRFVDVEHDKQPHPKKLYIKSVRFNYPATVVRWSDNTKTTAVHDKLKRCNHIHADEERDQLLYTYPEDPEGTYHTESLTDWKETGFTFAIVKKLVPNYFDLLDKWCN